MAITEHCDQAQLSLRARLELFRQVCDAIQHAHQKGVIHRDIKPSNVLVTNQDGVPAPKVIDFGVAKATSAELTQKTLFTRFAQIIGTPEYMAPEQADGCATDIDTRADIYSLGALLYELLTGTKPFDLETALKVGYQGLLKTIREVDPARPSLRISTLGNDATPIAVRRLVNADTLRKRLHGDLDWIVMKALEKDRARRYDSASGFADDITRYLNQEPVGFLAEVLEERVRQEREADSPSLNQALTDCGTLSLALGRYEDAEPLFGEALERLVDVSVDEEWRAWRVRGSLGAALAGQGYWEDAEVLILESVDWMRSSDALPTVAEADELDVAAEALARCVELYRAWDAAEPDRGHGAEAERWSAELAARGRR